ncbi:MFS transporter [Ornithinimicrobium panacihumi]|uniref:MFS transporter n=1 Tax=Ornithinimicrobium panacihumi TaxID=2008449 RepID=UPI003F8CB7E1
MTGERGGVHKVRDFRRLWFSNVSQEVGRQFGTLALSVTAVVVLEAAAWQVGLIMALGTSAYLVIGLPAGVWVDRWRKRPVLVTSDLLRAAATLSVPIAYVGEWLTVGHLMLVAAIISFTSVFSDTAQTAFVPTIVGPTNVSEATARLQSTDTTIQVVGPAVAAALLTRMAAPVLYVITAVTGVLSAAAAWSIRAPEPRQKGVQHPPFRRSLVAGFGFIRHHPVLRVFLVTNGLINTGAGVFATLIVLVALEDFGLSASSYALAGSIGATGGILGSLIAMPIRNRVGAIRTMLVCYWLLPLAGLILPLGYVLPGPGAVFVAGTSFAFGLVVVVSSISGAGLRAEVTPLDMMGRVTSAHRFVSLGAMPVGALLGGLVGGPLPYGVVLLLSPCLLVVAATVLLLSPLRPHRNLPEEWKHREPTDEARRSSPVMLTEFPHLGRWSV